MLLLHVDIRIMILYCRYLGLSGGTVLLLNLQCEANSGRTQQETIYKGNLI